jgi:bifunctional DNA-binding transcriptional regulator/antitoxin component of YhaV-PrlF toxin-antitoxin module
MVAVKLGPDGRLLIPIELRRTLGVKPGEPLVARVDEAKLVIERREDALRRVQARFAAIPADVDLATELIDERRAEAERDRA